MQLTLDASASAFLSSFSFSAQAKAKRNELEFEAKRIDGHPWLLLLLLLFLLLFEPPFPGLHFNFLSFTLTDDATQSLCTVSHRSQWPRFLPCRPGRTRATRRVHRSLSLRLEPLLPSFVKAIAGDPFWRPLSRRAYF